MKEEDIELTFKILTELQDEESRQVNEFLLHTYALIHELKEVIKHADDDERKVLAVTLGDMKKRVEHEAKKLYKSTGVKEKDVTALAADEEYFTSFQRDLMGKIESLCGEMESVAGAPAVDEAKEAADRKVKAKKGAKSAKGPKKKNWLRS